MTSAYIDAALARIATGVRVEVHGMDPTWFRVTRSTNEPEEIETARLDLARAIYLEWCRRAGVVQRQRVS